VTQYQLGEKARLRRRYTREAIALAMQSRWEEAVATNKSIIEVFPDDVDACNRLGKALTELGRYSEAREAYQRALDINPNNSIARKNLQRLSLLKEEATASRNGRGVDPHLFIEETGRTGVTALHNLAPREVLATMSAGDPVNLRVDAQRLVVEDDNGVYLGEVESKLGLRLIRLMEAGNRYIAAITSLSEDSGRVLIRETFQHPSQVGRPSFPPQAVEGFRPYVKDTMLKYDLDEEEEEESKYPSGWEEEPLEPAVAVAEDVAVPLGEEEEAAHEE